MPVISNGDTVSQSPLAIETLFVNFRFLSDLHISLLSAVPDAISGDMESAMAVELNPWVEYEFRVVATNKIGTGDPSAPSRVIRTNEAGKNRIKRLIFQDHQKQELFYYSNRLILSSLVHICVFSYHCSRMIYFVMGSQFILIRGILFNLQKCLTPSRLL